MSQSIKLYVRTADRLQDALGLPSTIAVH